MKTPWKRLAGGLLVVAAMTLVTGCNKSGAPAGASDAASAPMAPAAPASPASGP